MPTDDPPNVPVRTVETALDLVEAVQEANGGRLTALADAVGVSKSTAHNHLRTLERRGYVVREDDEYRVGLRFLDHGGHARARDSSYQLIEPKVRELAAETGEICEFVVEECGVGVVVFRERGDRAVETRMRVGARIPLPYTAAGKTILANLPEERRRAVLDDPGSSTVDATAEPPPQAELSAQFDRIAERGYAVNREDYIKGLRAVAAPVTTAQGRLIGGLSLSGPSHRFSDESYERELVDSLLGVANELELNVSYSRF